jgi:hypothetical protein
MACKQESTCAYRQESRVPLAVVLPHLPSIQNKNDSYFSLPMRHTGRQKGRTDAPCVPCRAAAVCVPRVRVPVARPRQCRARGGTCPPPPAAAHTDTTCADHRPATIHQGHQTSVDRMLWISQRREQEVRFSGRILLVPEWPYLVQRELVPAVAALGAVLAEQRQVARDTGVEAFPAHHTALGGAGLPHTHPLAQRLHKTAGRPTSFKKSNHSQ